MYNSVHPVLHGRVDDLRKGVIDVLLPLLEVELGIPQVGVGGVENQHGAGYSTMKPFVLSRATWFIACWAAQSAVALMSDPVFFSATRSSFTTAGMFTHSPRSTASPV